MAAAHSGKWQRVRRRAFTGTAGTGRVGKGKTDIMSQANPDAVGGDHLSRRRFARVIAGAAAGTFAAPAVLRGRNLNEKLNIAIIGCGGRGASNLEDVSSENIVALCDVYEPAVERAGETHSKARRCRDFRRLFDHANEFDAVVVSTTEHTHAFATLPAIQLGKHVYCEKPLTHNVWEARIIREAAAKARVATQMGTQIHATENYRRVVELVQTEGHRRRPRSPRLGEPGLGPAVGRGRQEARRHRLGSRSGPANRQRFPAGSTGTSGWVPRLRGRFTRCITRVPNGTAGGILATEP